jgi:MFS family permease
MLVFGRIGDIKGFRKIYTAGIIVFIAGSALASIPLSFSFLLFSRVIQAIGAAVLFSLTPAVIAFYFPEKSRGKIFGLNYSFTALGGIIGRAASGFIISEFGWNSIFYLNIPTGLISLYLIYKFLPDNLIYDIKNRFDFYSAVLVTSGLFLLMLFLNTGNQWGWTSMPVIFSIVFSVLFLSIMVIATSRSSSRQKAHVQPACRSW